MKAMALNSSDEGKIVSELKDWQNKGDCFLHDAVCLVSRNDILWWAFCWFFFFACIVGFVHCSRAHPALNDYSPSCHIPK